MEGVGKGNVGEGREEEVWGMRQERGEEKGGETREGQKKGEGDGGGHLPLAVPGVGVRVSCNSRSNSPVKFAQTCTDKSASTTMNSVSVKETYSTAAQTQKHY